MKDKKGVHGLMYDADGEAMITQQISESYELGVVDQITEVDGEEGE